MTIGYGCLLEFKQGAQLMLPDNMPVDCPGTIGMRLSVNLQQPAAKWLQITTETLNLGFS